ncbi:hypothetical protein WJX82_010609 [Trebouxia sp. C0006]
MLPSLRRLVFPGPQLGANQAKTDPISETCAGVWVDFEEPLACLDTRFAADAGVQLAACWLVEADDKFQELICPGRTWTGGWLKQKQPTSIPSKYGLDGHCYVSGYISGHRLLEVRLSAARRPQGILLRSTHTQDMAQPAALVRRPLNALDSQKPGEQGLPSDDEHEEGQALAPC